MAVVIDNHPSIAPLFSSCVPDWPLPLRVYIPSESEMALPARITDTCVWRSVQLQYTHASGVCDLRVWRPLQTLPCQVSYVYQRVWRWKWFSDQSRYVLQRLRLCRTSDTVFRREIDSRRQWGYGTFHGDSFPLCGGVYSITFSDFLMIYFLQWQLLRIHGQHCFIVERSWDTAG